MEHERLTSHDDLVRSIRVPDHSSTPADVAVRVRLDLLGGGPELATTIRGLLSKQLKSIDAPKPLLSSCPDEAQLCAAHDLRKHSQKDEHAMTHQDDARFDDLLAHLGDGDSKDLFRALLALANGMTGRATSVVLEWSDACSEPSADDGLAPDGGIVRHGVSGAPACRPPRVSHAPPTLTRPKAWTRLDRPGLGGSGRPNADEKNWGHMMPLHVGKFERFPSADRNELALAALEWCRAARASAGVKDSRFYWIDPNEIVVVTDAEPGAWGPGAGAEVSPQAAKAIFALADLARNTSTETWADARAGAEMFGRAQ